MNNIQIDLTIKMGDACENTMSLQEARELYKALDGLFGSQSSQLVPGINNTTPKSKNHASSTDHNNIRKVEHVSGGSQERTEYVKPATTNSNQYEETTLPPPNLKVEAARKRAAERTSGCGNRNK